MDVHVCVCVREQVGTEAMRTLQQLLWMQPGVHGARFSGAGTRGAWCGPR